MPGLDVVLAARVNLTRDLASADRAAHEAGIAYLESCADIAAALGAPIVGGPLYGAPLVFAGRAPSPVDERRAPAAHRRSGRGPEAGGHDAPAMPASTLGVEPLNRFETDIANTAGHALEIVERGGLASGRRDARHLPHEHGGVRHCRRHPPRRRAARAFPGQREQSRLRRLRPYRLAGDRAGRSRDIGYKGPIVLEPFRRDDERPGVPLAQWRAPTSDEDADSRPASPICSAALAFAGSAPMTPLRIGWIGCGTHANEMLLPQLTRHDVRDRRALRHRCRDG